MGSLGTFFKKPGVAPARFPRGSFTVDSQGEVVVSTLPQTFSSAQMSRISRAILSNLHAARELGVPLTELTVHFAGLQIRARDLAGGAIIFLTPQEF